MVLASTGLDPVTEPFTDRVDAAVTADAVKPRLAQALARLPSQQRDALLLLVWAELTYEQIATATGVPLGTVQSRISRARRRLREQLADLDQTTPMGDSSERVISLLWLKVDGTAVAGINAPATMPATHTITTKLMISPDGMGNGTLGGWRSIKYNYLDSLPTSPQALKQVILAQDKPGIPGYEPNQDVAVFDAIDTLFFGETEGALIPPKLAVALYGVLQGRSSPRLGGPPQPGNRRRARPAPRLVPTQRRPGPRAEARAVPLFPVLVVAGASRWG
jgi:hypothetical protein